MPRYMRANATKIGIAIAAAQIATWATRFRIREVSEQRDPAVDGDRGRGVTRVVARVRGQPFEAVDVRPLAVDDERRRPVHARLQRQSEDEEADDAPLAHERRGEGRHARDDRQHHASRDHRPDQRRVREPARPGVREPPHEPLVGRREPGAREQHFASGAGPGRSRRPRSRRKASKRPTKNVRLGLSRPSAAARRADEAVLVTVEHGEERALRTARRDVDSRPDAGGRHTCEGVRRHADVVSPSGRRET